MLRTFPNGISSYHPSSSPNFLSFSYSFSIFFLSLFLCLYLAPFRLSGALSIWPRIPEHEPLGILDQRPFKSRDSVPKRRRAWSRLSKWGPSMTPDDRHCVILQHHLQGWWEIDFSSFLSYSQRMHAEILVGVPSSLFCE